MKLRKEQDKWMPPRVYLHKVKGKAVSYILKPKGTSKSITLCKVNATQAEVWAAYESKTADLETTYTIRSLILEYLASPNFLDLAPRTQKDRNRELDNLSMVFGKMEPDNLLPHHIRKYMDLRGVKSRTQANHELSAISAVYSWGYERGRCKNNPARGVKKFSIKARDRYITDPELHALLECAEQRLRIAVEISYLCAARQGDVLKLTWSQIQEQGIYIQQGKTGKKQIKAWSDRLRAVVNDSKNLQGKIASIYVINKSGGGPLTADGLRSSWKRAISKMRNRYPELAVDFTFHDIKAKAISDFDGNLGEKQQFSGHKTLGQVNTYDRKVTVVPSLGSKKS